MARSSLSGALLGLIISVPIYYIWGIDGIVPAIIITSVLTLFRTWYFSRKIELQRVDIEPRLLISEAKDMITMGFMLSLSSLFGLAKNYGIRAFISNTGGIGEVGLYSAGFAIVNTYVGMVFTAMSTDYYPRLSAIASDNNETKKLINQQAEISMLILGPIISIFIVFIGWIIVLLYSNKFTSINLMIQWASIGILFKAVTWSMGFIFLAKGKSKQFLANEIIGGLITLILSVLGYYFKGLTGMGVGFMAGYIYMIFQIFIVSKYYYQFSFEAQFVKVFLIQLSLAIISFIVIETIDKPKSYFIGTAVILVSVIYSYKELDKRIDIKDLFSKLLKKKKNI